MGFQIGAGKNVFNEINDFVKRLKTPQGKLKVIVQQKKSIDWFKEHVQNIRITPKRILNDKERQTENYKTGDMIFYQYDPKYKKTLPYYDIFPLVFPFTFTSDGFIGLNMHYLNLQLRAVLMKRLYDLRSDKSMNDQTRLILSWDILKNVAKFPEVAPTVHRYLYSHIRSKIVRIASYETPIALFLPIAQFKKKSQEYVWQQSKSIIRKQKAKKKA